MDEMANEFGNFILIIIAMAVVMSLIIALSALRRGWRSGRTGHWRRIVAFLNFAIFVNLITACLGILANENFRDNEWFWLTGFVTLPLLLGYAFGSTFALSLGNLRITRSGNDGH